MAYLNSVRFVRVIDKDHVELCGGLRNFRLDHRNLKLRMANIKKQGGTTSVESACLAEMNRLAAAEVKA